jgi:hypothetical protein
LSITNIENYNQFSSNEPLERTLAWRRLYIIDGINEFIAGLKTLNDKEEIESKLHYFLSFQILTNQNLSQRQIKRKIDESLFWQLIDEARKTSTDQFNFLDNLKSTLQGLIRKN